MGEADKGSFTSEDEEVAAIIERVTAPGYFTLKGKAESSKEAVDAFIKSYKRLEKFLLSQLKMEHILINGNTSQASHSYTQQ